MSNTTIVGTIASDKQRRAIMEAVGEFGLACDRAAHAHREEAEALSRWSESRSNIAVALCDGRVSAAAILQHYADTEALCHAEDARVKTVDTAKRRHRDILRACLLLAEFAQWPLNP